IICQVTADRGVHQQQIRAGVSDPAPRHFRTSGKVIADRAVDHMQYTAVDADTATRGRIDVIAYGAVDDGQAAIAKDTAATVPKATAGVVGDMRIAHSDTGV